MFNFWKRDNVRVLGFEFVGSEFFLVKKMIDILK